MQSTSDAVKLPDDETNIRRTAGRKGGDDASSGADDAKLLLMLAYRETWLVGKVDQGQVKGIAKIQESECLFSRSNIH